MENTFHKSIFELYKARQIQQIHFDGGVPLNWVEVDFVWELLIQLLANRYALLFGLPVIRKDAALNYGRCTDLSMF